MLFYLMNVLKIVQLRMNKEISGSAASVNVEN
ncbi:hypothetical protein HBHAL_5122 [Halobacillus halophilus DSM 2266]|uniref:Uncharacterized protein n=1 Tax=Halobacillus halophilus (strain ATCC 35676 / DSM 2266 / JCM 20832 / KCTC 3685 / LMG 17431 / NBRC 102448 / NCIMB 2269) TaxID=866895 RepID=I0JTI5_HALH3|nr:hypothetical protein HBHAL_5122 [Halobacillus halophilus DSM 2266]